MGNAFSQFERDFRIIQEMKGKMMKTIGFREKLAKRQEAVGSLVCVGLDPLPEKLPKHLKRKYWHSKN